MGPVRPLLILLDAASDCDEQIVGGKAAKLSHLARAGFQVPRGFCLTTWAYEAFVSVPVTRATHGRSMRLSSRFLGRAVCSWMVSSTRNAGNSIDGHAALSLGCPESAKTPATTGRC